MCLLIVLNRVEERYPIVVASNRDELRSRAASPPGLQVGEQRRMLAPRDRRAGGTWIGVNDSGLFACLTNLTTAKVEAERSRGHLPLMALDRSDLQAGIAAVAAEVEGRSYAGFQLLLADGQETWVLEHDGGQLQVRASPGAATVISNEHRLGELVIPGLEAAADRDLDLEKRLSLLAAILLDEGDRSGHRVLKKGGEYGTVSSSIMAISPEDPRSLIWRYAKGPPDEAAYLNYGNLGRRLLEG